MARELAGDERGFMLEMAGKDPEDSSWVVTDDGAMRRGFSKGTIKFQALPSLGDEDADPESAGKGYGILPSLDNPKEEPWMDLPKDPALPYADRKSLYRLYMDQHGYRNPYMSIKDEEAQNAQLQHQQVKDVVGDYRNNLVRINGIRNGLGPLLSKNPNEWTDLESQFYNESLAEMQSLQEHNQKLRGLAAQLKVPEYRFADERALRNDVADDEAGVMSVPTADLDKMATEGFFRLTKMPSDAEIRSKYASLNKADLGYIKKAIQNQIETNRGNIGYEQSQTQTGQNIAGKNTSNKAGTTALQSQTIQQEAEKAEAVSLYNSINEVDANNYAAMQEWVKTNDQNIRFSLGPLRFNLNAPKTPEEKHKVKADFMALKDKLRVQAGVEDGKQKNKFAGFFDDD